METESRAEANKNVTIAQFKLKLCQVNDFKEAFEIFDVNGTGKIDMEGLKVAVRALGFETDKREIKRLVSEVNPPGDYDLSFENFLCLIERKMAEIDYREDLTKMFRIIDDQNTGKITLDELRRVATAIGEDVNDEELLEMIEEGDVKNLLEINLEQFMRLLQRSHPVTIRH